MSRRNSLWTWGIVVGLLGAVGLCYLPVTSEPVKGINYAEKFVIYPDNEPRGPERARSERSSGFVGGQACAQCHESIYRSFLQTSHATTAAAVTVEDIQSKLTDKTQRVNLGGPTVHVELKTRPEGAYQTAIAEYFGSRFTYTERFDLAVGSGKMGHSYFYWKNSRLFQLPVSYVSIAKEWRNSPGFGGNTAIFARPIPARCLECHAAFVDADPQDQYVMDRHSVITGIACELCHGRGKQHVEYHAAHPEVTESEFIVRAGTLSRERQIDVCSLCHAGGGDLRDVLKPPYSFQPGERLDSYLKHRLPEESAIRGPHSNDQFLRLSRSRCFQQSEKLVCTTCHDPHTFERRKTSLFSKRCQQCHQPEDCGKSAELGELARLNCIDCHMAKAEFELHSVDFFAKDANQDATLLRDHWIRVLDLPANSVNAIVVSTTAEFFKQQLADIERDETGEVVRIRCPSQFPPQALSHMPKFSKLQDLDISGIAVDNHAVAILAQLKSLRHLVLSKTGLTDTGLQQLGGLTSLRKLNLSSCTQVTDEGLDGLLVLKQLESLDLRDTSVTDAGFQRLRTALPDCVIER